ncbi:MAG: hypothetical protein ACRDKT_09340 [Actinomycetota bacterium]
MTKRLIAVVLAAGLLAGGMTMPADAAKKKRKKKPVPTTMFLDGTSQWGEEDQIANGTYPKLAAAAGDGEKSMMIPNYVGGPNTECAGNSLMPVFVGGVAGRVVGDLKITFDATASPGASAEIRVWPDLSAQACNEDYVPPFGSTTVELPAGGGTVEATIEGVDFTAQTGMMIQITSVIGVPPSYARVFYGTETSKIEFSCTPTSGKTCITG